MVRWYNFLGTNTIIVVKWFCFNVLWLHGVLPSELRSMPSVLSKMQSVRAFREKSVDKNTQKWADFPALFQTDRQPRSNYIGVPEVSSERRKYIPIGFLNSEFREV